MGVEDSSTEEANKCNDKIKTIYDQFKELESTLSEMDTDFSNTIGDQVEALNGVIDELCKEGDGLSSQITSSSKTVGEEVDNLGSKFSAGPSVGSSVGPSVDPTPVGTVRDGWIKTNNGWDKVN